MTHRNYRQVNAPEGYVTTDPMPAIEELADLYAQVYFQECATVSYQHVYSDEELAHKRMRARLILYALAQVDPAPKGRLIEVGVGEGFALAAAAAAGFDVVGVDFSSDSVNRFHPHLLDKMRIGEPDRVIDELVAGGQRFSACILHHVLEHVTDPRATLNRLGRLLDEDGLIAVTIPNDVTLLQADLKRRGLVTQDYWWAPPQHLQYFNTDNFPSFVESCEFEVVDHYGDFPIEFFLFHSGSNYVVNRNLGKPAHQARIMIDMLLAERGLDKYHAFCQALSGCGIGRSQTALLRKIRA